MMNSIWHNSKNEEACKMMLHRWLNVHGQAAVLCWYPCATKLDPLLHEAAQEDLRYIRMQFAPKMIKRVEDCLGIEKNDDQEQTPQQLKQKLTKEVPFWTRVSWMVGGWCHAALRTLGIGGYKNKHGKSMFSRTIRAELDQMSASDHEGEAPASWHNSKNEEACKMMLHRWLNVHGYVAVRYLYQVDSSKYPFDFDDQNAAEEDLRYIRMQFAPEMIKRVEDCLGIEKNDDQKQTPQQLKQKLTKGIPFWARVTWMVGGWWHAALRTLDIGGYKNQHGQSMFSKTIQEELKEMSASEHEGEAPASHPESRADQNFDLGSTGLGVSGQATPPSPSSSQSGPKP